MASIEVFTEEEDEILITLVSQYPLLYNLSLEDYKNNRKKDKVWSEIAEKLNKRSDSCKKHWKNLKDTYFRQKRKNKSGTGSAAPKNPRSKFGTYTKLFSFLESVPNERPTLSTVGRDEISTQESSSSQMSTRDRSPVPVNVPVELDDLSENNKTEVSPSPPPESPSVRPSFPKSHKKRTKKEDILSYLQNREVSRQKILENLSNKKEEDDEIVSFSEHVKIVLKKLKPVRKLQAKREFFDILMKYELLDVESDTESNRPGTSNSYVSSISSVERATPEQQDTPTYTLSTTESNRPGTSNSYVYSINSVERATPEQHQQDTPAYTLTQYTLSDPIVPANLPPIYSPISQDTLDEEEPTDLSLIQFHGTYYEQ